VPDEDDAVLGERLAGRVVLNDDRWDSHRREHEREREMVEATRSAMDKRLDLLNEFRQQSADRDKNFVTRDLHDALVSEVERRVNLLREDFNKARADDIAAYRVAREEDRRVIATLQANTNRLEGALAIARFLGAAGILAAVVAIARANGLI
jgi:hypothetical protein